MALGLELFITLLPSQVTSRQCLFTSNPIRQSLSRILAASPVQHTFERPHLARAPEGGYLDVIPELLWSKFETYSLGYNNNIIEALV